MTETTCPATDVHEAEDHARRLADVLRRFLHPSVGFDADRAALAVLEDFADYCRPSCGYLEAGTCSTGDGCCCPCCHDGERPGHPRLASAR